VYPVDTRSAENKAGRGSRRATVAQKIFRIDACRDEFSVEAGALAGSLKRNAGKLCIDACAFSIAMTTLRKA
jgi:hypothetical protein